MGGEWEFIFKKEKFDPADLDKYQQLLKDLKQKYEPKMSTDLDEDDRNRCYFFNGNNPPEDNIFAAFTYKCDGHSYSTDRHENAGWYLIWNPTIEVDKRINEATLHGRCAPGKYMRFCKKIQEDLMRVFPKYFTLFEDDDLRGCGYEFDMDDYNYDNSSNEEALDYTACDKECGYCGKCDY